MTTNNNKNMIHYNVKALNDKGWILSSKIESHWYRNLDWIPGVALVVVYMFCAMAFFCIILPK